jgi:hypothetical protein
MVRENNTWNNTLTNTGKNTKEHSGKIILRIMLGKFGNNTRGLIRGKFGRNITENALHFFINRNIFLQYFSLVFFSNIFTQYSFPSIFSPIFSLELLPEKYLRISLAKNHLPHYLFLRTIHLEQPRERMPRGSYIKDLQEENLERARKIESALLSVNEIRSYLMSSKFQEDTTVQVRDILLRLDNVSRELV